LFPSVRHLPVGLYDRYLAFRVRRSGALPETIAVAITERDLLAPGAYDTLQSLFEWAFAFDADRVVTYVSVLDEAAIPALRSGLADLDTPRRTAIRGPDDDRRAEAPIQIGIGLGGKHEFTAAARSLAEAAADGDLDPEAIDAGAVEDRLVFPSDLDLLVRTGEERLSDFMIWQSVYSELYFTDVNWRDFRRRDYLRALRAYADRSRRFGR
jgi:undecaprenyl diphosphate synthase